MNNNTWILSAIQDLQELANQHSLDRVSAALDSVYAVAEFELAEPNKKDQVKAHRLSCGHFRNAVGRPVDNTETNIQFDRL